MPGRISREKLVIIGLVFGLIISFVTWNILGFLSTTILARIFWTVMAFGGGISGLIFLVTYLEYEYNLYKDRQNKSTKSSDLADSEPSGFKFYSPKGFIVFLLASCILMGFIVTVAAARIGALTGANALTLFGEGVKIGASITIIVYAIWHEFRNSRFGPKKQELPKKLPVTRGRTVLEAEHHGLTEFHLEEIHNLHRLTRINLGLNQLKTINLAPLSGSAKLKELILYMNHLETIDLSPLASCPNLEYLDLTDNDLETIDLTPLTSCLKLDALNIGINKTSEIDLSPLSECRDLKILTIDGMSLKEVELSPLKNCTKLEFLKLDDNELISLDVTPLFECKSLTEFPIDKIELTTTLSRSIEEWPEGIRKHRKRFRKS
ncbi:MAG: leucine-rich repeat domain-containing protein [Candidatus Thorarchaeota archaeon SMTZ1-45]|nr:MAG: hypothetical protein AM325_03885 [Candidatus Thorarchaeota archaeon SMTZ1-45]